MFDKHPQLIVYDDEPFNAGPPADLLGQHFLTPQPLFFVRSHGAIPVVNVANYQLTIDGMIQRPLRLSLADLQQKFPPTILTATLQCAGNRRKELLMIKPVAGELPWDTNAISNAEWRGARLQDILATAGIEPGARYVAFTGLDINEHGDTADNFGASISIDKAMHPEMLLAYEMNGQALTPAHGFPLRVIAPGYIGARSVKWLSRITVQAEPSDSYYQARAYKLFPPEIDEHTANWTQGLTLETLPISSVITSPEQGAILCAGRILVQGYAVTGDGYPIKRVEVSLDQGQTWKVATMRDDPQPWAWRLWQIALDLSSGSHEIIVRAWDSAGNTQPDDLRKVWNFKGYANNAWHHVAVQVVA